MSESNKRSHSTTKRNTVAVVAIILVCILAIGGTIAYLTSRSQLTNTFTVGQINPIDPGKPGPDPDGPDGPVEGKPIPEDDKNDKTKLNGNLYEPSWVKDSKLLPSATIEKDPFVGVGPGSEPSVVYVYVNNTMTNNDHIYFTIDKNNWEPVDGQVTVVKGNPDQYIGGLFKYKNDLDASKVETNVWTATPLFENVEVSKDAKAEDFQNKDASVGAIEVNAFLHQKNDADGQPIEQKTILDAVKQAFSLK